MKNPALSIGAEALAAEAAALEEKLKTNDIKAFTGLLPAFYENVKNTANRIREAL